MGLSVCLSVKSHLTSGASVGPENTVTYSAGNEGQKMCGVFSENSPLLRSSGVAVVSHTLGGHFSSRQKWCTCVLVFTVILAEPQGNTQLAQCLSTTFSLAQMIPPALVGARTDGTTTRVTVTTRGVANFCARALA